MAEGVGLTGGGGVVVRVEADLVLPLAGDFAPASRSTTGRRPFAMRRMRFLAWARALRSRPFFDISGMGKFYSLKKFTSFDVSTMKLKLLLVRIAAR